MRRAFFRSLAAGGLVAAASCIASAPDDVDHHHKKAGTGGAGGAIFNTTNQTSASATSTGSGNNDPHAVLGLTPPHGPFTGGNNVIIAGKGFTELVHVWFGDVEVKSPVAIDPNKVQVTVPAHAPGAVDVSVQDGEDASTKRTLPGGYTYDVLYADPDAGPVSGGTVITIYGSGNHWDKAPSVEADIDGKPCISTTVLGADSLSCVVPKGTPGAKTISVITGKAQIDAYDAYTYQDSTNGFKGGLSGQKLAGKLTVLAFDYMSGDPIAGAHVIVGTDLATGLYKDANDTGVAQFQDPSLKGAQTVTVTAYCHSPITFVDVPVDTVTVYLDSSMTPACASSGDPPPVGGKPILAGQVSGELVWPHTEEFKKGKWDNVPVPGDGEERVAFVFFAVRDRTKPFQLPGATSEVYETSPGDAGYGFQNLISIPGYQAMYALAGIRNKATQAFTAYVFGATKGVSVFPGETTANIVINMTHALDQKLVIQPNPPGAGPKGPDRLHTKVAIEIAQNYYALLPKGDKTALLPLASQLSFVVPPLDKDLTGDRYIVLSEAVSGAQMGAPISSVRGSATTSAAKPLVIDGFVKVPLLTLPKEGGGFDGRHLAMIYPAGGFPADLTVYELIGAGSYWLVVVPKADNSITVPDLSGFQEAGLPQGPVQIALYGGHVDKFDYGKLTYQNLSPNNMAAYALDWFDSFY